MHPTRTTLSAHPPTMETGESIYGHHASTLSRMDGTSAEVGYSP